MKDILVLRELEQIKAISNPYRVEILESFEVDEPQSAKQIAEKLGEPHAKVNYHIKTLLKVGILDLVDEKVKSGIIEKYYLPAAKALVIDKSFMKNTEEEIFQSLNAASISIFEKISEDFYKAVENPEEPKFINHYQEYSLTKEELRELMKKVEDFVRGELKGKKNKKPSNDSVPCTIATIGITKLKANASLKK